MALGAAQKFVKAVLKLWAGFRPQIKAGIRPSKWDQDADTRLFPQGSSHVSRGSGASERQKNDPQDFSNIETYELGPRIRKLFGFVLFLNTSSGADLGQELAPREAELPVLNWARIPACRGRMLKFGAGFRPRSGAGFRPRLGPDAGPDLGPDSGPELAGCFIFGTDSGPDLRPDSGPDLRPDSDPGGPDSGPNSRPDSGPDLRPDSGPQEIIIIAGAGFRPRFRAGFRPRFEAGFRPRRGEIRPKFRAGFRPRFKAGFWPSWGEIRL